METTAQRLAKAMEAQGMDQTDLAAAIGVTQGAISKILVGKTANSRLLPRIAVELRVPLSWLLCKTDNPHVKSSEFVITDQDREWLDALHRLGRHSRAAVIQLAQSLAERREAFAAEDRLKITPDDSAVTDTVHTPRLEYRGK